MKPKHVWNCFLICYSVGFLFLAVVAGISTSAQAQSEPEWQRQAEDNFYLRPGMADQLMTKHEWEQHWKEMQNMGPQQQAQYRQEWHVKMMQRAREKGIDVHGGMGPHHGTGKSGAQGSGSSHGGSQNMGQGGQPGQGKGSQ